jgi:hypothetical protein
VEKSPVVAEAAAEAVVRLLLTDQSISIVDNAFGLLILVLVSCLPSVNLKQ